MTRFRFYTATTLDGFIADEHDNLDWLLSQPIEEDGPFNYGEFIADIGALVMGATTYQWVLDHNARTGESWSYTQPTWVFTHRELAAVTDDVRIVAGTPTEFRQTLVDAAGEKDVWIVGGGDLAAQFADANMLDEVIVSIAPVTLGCARYDVVGPRSQ